MASSLYLPMKQEEFSPDLLWIGGKLNRRNLVRAKQWTAQVTNEVPITNNYVEGWHNWMKPAISCTHPTPRLLIYVLKILLHFSVATLFRSFLVPLAVGLRTLASQVRAQRHSRIACYIVFRHTKISRKKNSLRFSVDTLFRSWLASLAVGLRTLVSQVRAQRHSRIPCYIVFP